MDDFNYFMRLALQEAEAAAEENEVPVGAIIVHEERRVIASDHNRREQLRDPTAHAEMLAITQASEALGSWRLDDCTLYVTLEPCIMCAGALYWAQITRIVYGATDIKRGFTQLPILPLHPTTSVTNGILETECATILSNFFKAKR